MIFVVDYVVVLCCVLVGDVDFDGSGLQINWILWVVGIVGVICDWLLLMFGEQVVLFCLMGDLVQGVVLCGVYLNVVLVLVLSLDIYVWVYLDGVCIMYDYVVYVFMVELLVGVIVCVVVFGLVVVQIWDVIVQVECIMFDVLQIICIGVMIVKGLFVFEVGMIGMGGVGGGVMMQIDGVVIFICEVVFWGISFLYYMYCE